MKRNGSMKHNLSALSSDISNIDKMTRNVTTQGGSRQTRIINTSMDLQNVMSMTRTQLGGEIIGKSRMGGSPSEDRKSVLVKTTQEINGNGTKGGFFENPLNIAFGENNGPLSTKSGALPFGMKKMAMTTSSMMFNQNQTRCVSQQKARGYNNLQMQEAMSRNRISNNGGQNSRGGSNAQGQTGFSPSNSSVVKVAHNEYRIHKDTEQLNKFMALRKNRQINEGNSQTAFSKPDTRFYQNFEKKISIEKILGPHYMSAKTSPKLAAGDIARSSTGFQQTIIQKLKLQQRQKQKIDISPETQNMVGMTSTEIIDANMKNSHNIATGKGFGYESKYFPRSAKHIFMPQDTDWGISYKECSDVGKMKCQPGEGHQQDGTFLKDDNKLDVNILENWLNNTLKAAENFQIPGVIKRNIQGSGPSNGGKCSHCIEYGIDRLTLNNTGISNCTIDQLYRQLFNNTLGFFNSLEDIMKQQANDFKMRNGGDQGKQTSAIEQIAQKQSDGQKRHVTKASLLTAFWRVYGILFEYAYSANYQLQICEIMEENRKKEAITETQFNKVLAESEKQIKEMRQSLQVLQGQIKKLTEELKVSHNDCNKQYQDLEKRKQTHEEEVALRLKIEARLNHLHSLNRHMEGVVDRTTLSLAQNEQELNILYEKFYNSQEHLKTAKSEKAELNQWKIKAEDRLEINEKQLDILAAKIKQFKIDKRQLNETNVMQEREIRDLNEKICILEQEVENGKVALANMEKSHKKSKNTAVTSTKALKDTNRKFEEQAQKLENVQNKQQQLTKAFDLADKNRKKYKDQSRKLLEDKTGFKEEIKKKDIDRETVSEKLLITAEELQRYIEHFEDGVLKIQDFNDERKNLLAEIKFIQENIECQEVKILDLSQSEANLSEKNHKLEADLLREEQKFAAKSKDFNEERLKHNALRKNTDDKIAYLTQAAKIEKMKCAAIEDVIETEQVKCQVAMEKVSKFRAQIAQQENMIELQKCDLETKSQEISQLNDNVTKLNQQINEAVNKYDKMKNQWQAAVNAQEFYQIDKERCLAQLEEEYEDRLKTADVEKMMEEDFASHLLREQNRLKKVNIVKDKMAVEIENYIAKIHKFDIEMDEVRHQSELTQNQYDILLAKTDTFVVQLDHAQTRNKEMGLEIQGFRAKIVAKDAEVKDRDETIEGLETRTHRIEKKLKAYTDRIFHTKGTQMPLVHYWAYEDKMGKEVGATDVEDAKVSIETPKQFIDPDPDSYSQIFSDSEMFLKQFTKAHHKVKQFPYKDKYISNEVQCEILQDNNDIEKADQEIQTSFRLKFAPGDDADQQTQDSGTLTPKSGRLSGPENVEIKSKQQAKQDSHSFTMKQGPTKKTEKPGAKKDKGKRTGKGDKKELVISTPSFKDSKDGHSQRENLALEDAVGDLKLTSAENSQREANENTGLSKKEVSSPQGGTKKGLNKKKVQKGSKKAAQGEPTTPLQNVADTELLGSNGNSDQPVSFSPHSPLIGFNADSPDNIDYFDSEGPEMYNNNFTDLKARKMDTANIQDTQETQNNIDDLLSPYSDFELLDSERKPDPEEAIIMSSNADGKMQPISQLDKTQIKVSQRREVILKNRGKEDKATSPKAGLKPNIRALIKGASTRD